MGQVHRASGFDKRVREGDTQEKEKGSRMRADPGQRSPRGNLGPCVAALDRGTGQNLTCARTSAINDNSLAPIPTIHKVEMPAFTLQWQGSRPALELTVNWFDPF